MRHGLTIVQNILIQLANRGCLTLEELEKLTKAKRSVLLVELTRLYKKELYTESGDT